MRYVFMWMLLWLACASALAATPAERLLLAYRIALQQQDIAALSRLIAPNASVRLTLQQGTDASTFTLTRAEFLQQQAALWRFAKQADVTLTEQQSAADQLRFLQQDDYALFHQLYRLRSDVTLTLAPRDGALLISAISLHSEVQ